jgi:hypothetical protein
MALNGTMVKIETVTVGSGGSAAIEFTNIPATYTDLLIRLSARSTHSAVVEGVVVRFNNDTTSGNYSHRRLYGNGASAVSDTSTIPVFMDGATATASTFANNEIYIPNYAGSTNKSWSADLAHENNATTAYVGMVAGLWSNTNAITSIKLTSENAANFAQYSTATLYGISRTTAQIKATGGMVYDDASYVYHLFNSRLAKH